MLTAYFEVNLKTHKVFFWQGKYMDIEFDFKGDPLGGVISNCEYFTWILLKKFRIVKRVFIIEYFNYLGLQEMTVRIYFLVLLRLLT